MNFQAIQRRPRIHDERHLAWVRRLPCLICKNEVETEACHVRMADPSIGKLNSGLGQKPHDYFVVPLCGAHHRRQHMQNEREWWAAHNVDPVKLALMLFAVSGDHQEAERIIRAAFD